MTALVLNSLSYSTNLLEYIGNTIKKTLQGIMVGWMIARQAHVNSVIASHLIKTAEYKDTNYQSLLAELNYKSIQQIHKEFGE